MSEMKEQTHKAVVESVDLQSSIRFGGKEETSLSNLKFPGIKMLWIKGEGVLVKHGKHEGMVPSTNVKIARFAPDKD